MVCYVRCDNYTFNVNSYNRNYNSHVIIGGPQLKIYHVTGLTLSKKAPKSVKVEPFHNFRKACHFTIPIFENFTKSWIQRGAILYDFWNFTVYLKREKCKFYDEN